MGRTTTRIGGGFLALAAIWIGVYWLWEPPRSPGVSFAPEGGVEEEPAPPPPSESAAPAEVEIQPPSPDPVPSPADPAAAPPDGVIPPQFRDYVVRDGQTFESIAIELYGSARYRDVVSKANPLVSPSSLRAGRVIRVPLDPENIQGLPTQPEQDQPPPEPQMIEYVVVKGDTLSELSQRFYGSMRYYEVIYNANKDRMRSMDDLTIGQTLLIPPPEMVLGPDGDR